MTCMSTLTTIQYTKVLHSKVSELYQSMGRKYEFRGHFDTIAIWQNNYSSFFPGTQKLPNHGHIWNALHVFPPMELTLNPFRKCLVTPITSEPLFHPWAYFACHTNHYCSSKLSKNDNDSRSHLEAYTAPPSPVKDSSQHGGSFLIGTSLISPVMFPKCALFSSIGHHNQVLLDSLEHCQQLALLGRYLGHLWPTTWGQLYLVLSSLSGKLWLLGWA